jgi:hypothetical protein
MMNSLILSAAGVGLSLIATTPGIIPVTHSEAASLLLQGIGLFALATIARRRPRRRKNESTSTVSNAPLLAQH